jgi:hypothetical protein
MAVYTCILYKIHVYVPSIVTTLIPALFKHWDTNMYVTKDLVVSYFYS